MQRVQRTALVLFANDGYGAVSIEAIAQAAEVGVATIFRHFGTKDRIVLWDEAEEDIAESLFAAVEQFGIRHAILGFAARLDEAERQFRQLVLARLALIQHEPELDAQAAINLRELGRGVSLALARRRGAKQVSLPDNAAGQVIAAALSTAISEWGRLKGKRPMRVLTEEVLSGVRSIMLE